MDVRTLLLAILAIAFTDIALQLDNAIAIATVASGVPTAQRIWVLAGGVLLAACCLLIFSFTGSMLVERLTWLKPVAGVVLVIIGVKLVLEVFQH